MSYQRQVSPHFRAIARSSPNKIRRICDKNLLEDKNKPFVMKVGVDFDGVIADTDRMKSILIKENLGIDIPPHKTRMKICVPLIGEHNYRMLKITMATRPSNLRIPEVEDAIQSLRELSRMVQLYLVTARIPKKLEYAKEWLKIRKALKLFAGFESSSEQLNGMSRTKKDICKAYGLHAFIDNNLLELEGMAMPNFGRILFTLGNAREFVPEDMHHAAGWNSAVSIVRDINSIL